MMGSIESRVHRGSLFSQLGLGSTSSSVRALLFVVVDPRIAKKVNSPGTCLAAHVNAVGERLLDALEISADRIRAMREYIIATLSRKQPEGQSPP